MTKIEWTERTWNPIVGCTVTSPGCTNCYAMKMAHRLASNPATPHYHGTTQMSSKGPVWTGKVGFSESVLLQPLKRKKPTTYFVNSMGDLFHPEVPDECIDKVFAVMALCPQHTFQVLTKQAERMREYFLSDRDECIMDTAFKIAKEREPLTVSGKLPYNRPLRFGATHINVPLPNVWLGVSAEDQTRADERIPHLLNTPAAIRFVSAEPLLWPVDLACYLAAMGSPGQCVSIDGDWWHEPGECSCCRRGLDWVIVGGESGPNARPMHPDWARGIRDQCEAAGVPFLFKQWGEWAPGLFEGQWNLDHYDGPVLYQDEENCGVSHEDSDEGALEGRVWLPDGSAGYWTDAPDDWGDETPRPASVKIGKKAAGRLLDGREWNDMPEVV